MPNDIKPHGSRTVASEIDGKLHNAYDAAENRFVLIQVHSFVILIVICRVEAAKSWPCYRSSLFNNCIDLKKINQGFIVA